MLNANSAIFQLYHGDTKYEYLKKRLTHFPYTCWLGCTL